MSERLIKAARDMLQAVDNMLACGEWYNAAEIAAELSAALLEAQADRHRGDARRHFICLCPDCIRPKPPSNPQVLAIVELNNFLDDWLKRHAHAR